MKLWVNTAGHSKWGPQSYHNQAELQDYIEEDRTRLTIYLWLYSPLLDLRSIAVS
jgi:hypothetical protein